jgi:hypothetical protein
MNAGDLSEGYRHAPMLRFPLGCSRELVRVIHSSSNHLLDSAEADLLFHCSHFRTLDEHAAACSRKPEYVEEIRARLTEMAERGLLISMKDIRELAKTRRGDVEVSPGVSCIAIPTCD